MTRLDSRILRERKRCLKIAEAVVKENTQLLTQAWFSREREAAMLAAKFIADRIKGGEK